ncbi:MAG: hypothetical protein ACRER2_15645 [Methylococcales bacterium]
MAPVIQAQSEKESHSHDSEKLCELRPARTVVQRTGSQWRGFHGRKSGAANALVSRAYWQCLAVIHLAEFRGSIFGNRIHGVFVYASSKCSVRYAHEMDVACYKTIKGNYLRNN